MEIIDVGNIDGEKFCAEFDEKLPLEDAANALAAEYKEFSKADDISVRSGVGDAGKKTYSVGTGDFDTRFRVGLYVMEDMPIYSVEQGPNGVDFEDFHKYLQEKYAAGSEE